MKGMVLAGGSGTRLMPLTKVTNKSILPVYNRPLIYEPIRALRDGGITDILMISGPGHAGQLLDLLGSGRDIGVDLSYDIQEEPKGLAHGLAIAEDFADGGKIAMVLGDNIFEESLNKAVSEFKNTEKGAHVILKKVSDPERFGVASFTEDGKGIANVIEKPEKAPSDWIVTGFYMYDERVFDIIRDLKPSKRGEYEITDVNNVYINEGTMSFTKTKGVWIDAGTFDSLLEATNFIAKRENG